MAWLPVTVNGHEFNTDDALDWQVQEFPGMGAAGSRRATGPRVNAHGSWSTTGFKTSKVLPLGGSCRPSGLADMREAISSLETTFPIAPVPVTVHWPDQDQTITAYRDGDIDIAPTNDRDFWWSCTLVADDPTWYVGGPGVPIGPGLPTPPSDGVTTLTTMLPASAGGLSFPFHFPFAFDATVTSGDLTFTTPRGGWWVFKIIGTVVNPRLIVLHADGTTRTLAWNLTVGAGEFLTVDPQQQTSMLQGAASRPPTIRQWPPLMGGQTTVQFRADSGDGSLVIYYVPAA